MKVYGVNSVLEAIKTGKASKIYLAREAKSAKSPKITSIESKARKMGIPVVYVPRSTLPAESKGVAADVAPIKYIDFDYIIEKAIREGKFILILDGVDDPHNLGACLRSAEFFGCAGVLIPKRRSAQVTEAVIRVSAGAALHVDVAREENLASAVKKLKKLGFYVIGAEVGGEELWKVSFTPPVAIVIGGEDKGISRPVRKQCDVIASIPCYGRVESLNLSVAAGIFMYEFTRSQRG
jgi:23S rRNA (guanosine2251-2'-O)-methyltransferase